MLVRARHRVLGGADDGSRTRGGKRRLSLMGQQRQFESLTNDCPVEACCRLPLEFVERPLWTSGHRVQTPWNVSCTLKQGIANASCRAFERPKVAETERSLPAPRPATQDSHAERQWLVTGAATNSQGGFKLEARRRQ